MWGSPSFFQFFFAFCSCFCFWFCHPGRLHNEEPANPDILEDSSNSSDLVDPAIEETETEPVFVDDFEPIEVEELEDAGEEEEILEYEGDFEEWFEAPFHTNESPQ